MDLAAVADGSARALAAAFAVATLATSIGVPGYAWVTRGRGYALFALVIVALAVPGAWVMHARLVEWLGGAAALATGLVFVYGMAAAGVHLAALARARLRPPLFRVAVSIPGMTFVAAGF